MAEKRDKFKARTVKSPRRLRPYPKSPKPLVRNIRTRAVIRSEWYRQKRPRRHARPWQYRTRLSLQAALEERAAQTVRGSLQERIVYQALVDWGLIPGVDFDFQSSMMGGRAELGGLVADFLFPHIRVIVQVQSYWHQISMEYTQRDANQVAILQSMGYTVLEVWPDTINNQAALDLWMDRNIMHMWGTSRQNFGTSHDRDFYFLNRHMDNLLELLRRLQAIVRLLDGIR